MSEIINASFSIASSPILLGLYCLLLGKSPCILPVIIEFFIPDSWELVVCTSALDVELMTATS